MEGSAVKAIMIGVAVFTAMAVITALLVYYNAAKSVADLTSLRIDIAENYDIDNVFKLQEGIKYNIDAIGMRSLIRQAAGEKNITVNISTVNGVNEENITFCSKGDNRLKNALCKDISGISEWVDSLGNIAEDKLESVIPIGNTYTFYIKYLNGEKSEVKVCIGKMCTD